MEIKVNELQAYKAKFLFLEKYNKYSNADKINILLESMDLSIFVNDERPADQALWNEWKQCL